MLTRSILLWFAAAATLAAADLPYAGKWKMNPAKSDFGEMTVTFTSLPSGEWESTAEGTTYKFRMDGKPYPNGLGQTAAWKSIDANTWETTWKLNDKLLFTQTLKTEAAALTVTAKGTKPNGDPLDEVVTLRRVSGGPGLAGKWKTKNLKTDSPSIIEFVQSGQDNLNFREPTMQLTCDAKLDGRDYACTGPTLPPGWTIAMTKLGARAVSIAVKKDGKSFYNETYTVSGDGKTLTTRGSSTATHEMYKVVYDRI